MWILFLLLMCSVSRADVYVITSQDNSIYSISEQDDAVFPNGYLKNIVKGNISNLPISGSPQLYNFSNGSFTLNKDKVQAKQADKAKAISDQKSEDDARNSAIAKLKALGLTDIEIKAIGKNE